MDCKRSLHAFIAVSIIVVFLISGHHVDANGNSCKYSAGPCTPKCNFYCIGYGAIIHGGHCEGNKCCCVKAASDLQRSIPN
ncbi:hypothetical protein Bca4012_056221 [Brassica carinata]